MSKLNILSYVIGVLIILNIINLTILLDRRFKMEELNKLRKTNNELRHQIDSLHQVYKLKNQQ